MTTSSAFVVWAREPTSYENDDGVTDFGSPPSLLGIFTDAAKAKACFHAPGVIIPLGRFVELHTTTLNAVHYNSSQLLMKRRVQKKD